MSTARQSDESMLVAPLRDGLADLHACMAVLGHSTVTIETWRHPLRAKMLGENGASKNGDRSLHCWLDKDGKPQSYAVDIGNARGVGKPGTKRAGKVDWWSDWVMAPDDKPVETRFFEELEDTAIALGWFRILSPGVKHVYGDGSAESWDAPHIQAIPVSAQNRFRAMKPDARLAELVAMRAKREASIRST